MKHKCAVLYISYNGLLEEIVPSQVVPYIRELGKEGFEFTLLTFEKKDSLKKAGRQGLARMRDELMGLGINWRWSRYHKRISLIATSLDVMAGALWVFYFILFKRIRIVHARSIVPAAMCLVSKLFNVKFIFDTRGLLAEEYVGGNQWKENCFKYKLVKFFEKACLMAADEIVVLTEKHKQYLKRFAYLSDKCRTGVIEVIPCCTDTNRFRCAISINPALKEKEGLRDSFIFVYPGKLRTHYMVSEMLDFFKIALDMIPNSSFLILTQDNSGHVRHLALEKGIALDKIIVKNPRFDEIPSLLSLAHAGLFLINPYKKFGSSPIKLGEFLSCGIPVIINKGIGDTEELVKTNRVGVVIEDFNPENYKRALLEFMELIKEGGSVNKRCRDAAMKLLSLDTGVEKYSKIYNRICHV